MIVGLFLSNYKCYGNANFIPFIKNETEKLNIFIGENGVGKSSIIEAIHCIMNEVPPTLWETTLGKKKDRAYIAPVFLIKKSHFQESPEFEAISNAFWNNDFIISGSDAPKEFTLWKNNIKSCIEYEKYYLFCIGKDTSGNILFTKSFHKMIFNKTRRSGVSKEIIKLLFKLIIEHYSYIYIPVENKISDALSLQAKEMQGLMDSSVINEINRLLSAKSYEVEGENRKSSIVDLINKNLGNYVEHINHRISEGYEFEAKRNIKNTVKANDIINVILKEYFSVRPLTKDGKHIESLSSGQQRLALIDVASTLLSTDQAKEREIILAIDEPENSLDSSHRFNQFSRLVNISEEFGHQILLTTHWYGLLLRPSIGRLNFIEENELSPRIKSFSLHNFYDQRGSFPNSIEIKSYFDLMSSMLSLLKKDKINWLICEGYEDALYLNTYLKNIVPKTYILPFNGCGNVKKLFQFLSVPFSDKDEVNSIKGKVFCLIDTDEKSLVILQDYKKNKKLKFNRLTLDRNTLEAKLVSVKNPNASNTEIEDVLDAKMMWDTLLKLSGKDEKLKKFMSEYSYVETQYSDLTKNLSFIKKETKEAYDSFDEFIKYLHSNKMKKNIVETYCDIACNAETLQVLPWMKTIVDYFNE